MTGCQRGPTPSSQDKICRSFLASMGNEFHSWPDVDEVDIVSMGNHSLVTSCYRPEDEDDLGWCGVNLNDDMKGRFGTERQI